MNQVKDGYRPAVDPSTPISNHLIFWRGNLLLAGENCTELFWPEGSDVFNQAQSRHYVGLFCENACWVYEIEDVANLEDVASCQLRELLTVDPECFDLASRAVQLIRWHKEHQYCGRCGSETMLIEGELARSCSACSLSFYPRVSPCMIVLIENGEYCLLARHARRNALHTCLAGFIEPAEIPEITVQREAMEEVGVQVSNIRYFGSQAWPFPGQLMLGYHADYAGGDIAPDGVEILSADWFHYSELPDHPGQATLSGQLIADFVKRCRAGLA
ncbi:NAD(+) diphosphatase [Porticoccaceae bacterium LTM1]|nr:NAD(+) diphosphatase [Porticoccaceae bacterium LTM1]